MLGTLRRLSGSLKTRYSLERRGKRAATWHHEKHLRGSEHEIRYGALLPKNPTTRREIHRRRGVPPIRAAGPTVPTLELDAWIPLHIACSYHLTAS